MLGDALEEAKRNVMFSERKYYDLPYISKSCYVMYKYSCRYKFKLVYIDKIQQEPNYVMQVGTVLHNAFEYFFDVIDYKYLYDLNWSLNHGTPQSMVYNYFVSVLESIIPDSVVDYRVSNNIKGFCRLEEEHWFNCRNKYNGYSDIIKHFKPMARESFYVNHEWKVYGTFDRIDYIDVNDFIIDYKTGKPPKYRKSGYYGEEYVKLSSSKVAEGNFYVFLNLLRKGYNFVKFDDGKYHCVDEFGNEYKVGNEQYAFVYTSNDDGPVVAKKKASIVSIRNIIKTLDKIRNENHFEKSLNYFICRNCPFALTHCKEDIQFDIY